LRNTAIFIFNLFVITFAMSSFFRYSEQIVRALRNPLPFNANQMEKMITHTRGLISESVGANLILAAIQGMLGGLSFAIMRLPAAFFWGVAMAFFFLVPVVGLGINLVLTALWLGQSGH